MSKKKKVDNAQETVVVEETENTKAVESGVVETTKDSKKKAKDDKKESKKDAKKDKKKDKKDKKDGLIKKTKATASELKKVTWPSFGEVVKKTGIVIAFVIIFGLLVFGVDTLLGYLVTLLVQPCFQSFLLRRYYGIRILKRA